MLRDREDQGTMRLPAFRPMSRGQIEDQTPVHLWVELEVEVIEQLVWVTELRLLMASLQQPFAAASKFVGDQDGDQIDGGHAFRLRLPKTRFHHRSHAAQAQLDQGANEFDQVHGLGSSK